MGKNDKSRHKFTRIFINILVSARWNLMTLLSFLSLSSLWLPDIEEDRWIESTKRKMNLFSRLSQNGMTRNTIHIATIAILAAPIEPPLPSPPLSSPSPYPPSSSFHRRCAACFAREFHELRSIAFDSSIGEPMASFAPFDWKVEGWKRTRAYIRCVRLRSMHASIFGGEPDRGLR